MMIPTLDFNCSCKLKNKAELLRDPIAPADSVVLRCCVIFATREASS